MISKRFFLIFGMIFLINVVSAATVFSDDFESGTLGGWGLSAASGANNWTASSTDPFQGARHAQGQPQSTTEPASTMERTISTSGYESIVVNYSRKLVGLDIADEFQMEWYSGSGWAILEQTGGNSANDADYISQQFSLPSSANNNPAFAVRFECTAGAVSEFCRVDNILITGSVIDNAAPSFSNYSENPANNSAYSQGQFYEFNVTINDSSSLSSVIINFDGVNYTGSSIRNISNVYIFNRTDLAAGTYNYYWWANDSLGNAGTSNTRAYAVAKATGQVSLLLNNLADNLTITYPQVSNASASTIYGTVSLYRNGTDITSQNNQNITRAAGYYNITAISSGNQNYSSATATYWLTINKATPTAILTSSAGWSINYSISTTIGSSESNSGDSDVSYVVYRDSVNKGSGETVSLGVGSYNYILNTTGGDNYSSVSVLDSQTLTINKTTPTPNMNITITPSNNVSYGTQTSASATESNSGDSDLTYSFYRDGVGVANPNIATLDAGTYVYTYNTSGGTNYTSGSVSITLTVSKANNPVSLLLNNQSGNLSLQYGQAVNASASSSSGVISLYKNNSLINSENNQNSTLGVGFYEYKVNSSGNQNYLENSTGIIKSVSVNKATSNVSLYLNNSRSNITIGQGDSLPVNVTLNQGQGNIYLYVDNILIYNGSAPLNTSVTFSSLGIFNVSAFYPETQNYTSSFETFWVNVSDDKGPLINITSPTSTTYTSQNNIALNFSISDSSSIDKCWYNINNGINATISNCQNTTFNVSSDGSYVLRFFSNDSLNNLGKSNVSFNVDSSGVFITIIDPIGVKSSRTGIPITYSVLGNNLTCWYNVQTSVGGFVIGNTTLSNCSNSSFDVSNDGDYVFMLFANNSLGTINSSNSSFSVSTSQPPPGGGGGGGGGSSGGSVISKKPSIEAGTISSIVVTEGGVKKISSWRVKNTGTSFLNSCNFKSQGANSGWIPKTETKGLAAGEEYTFVFDVNIPENIEEGDYNLEVLVDCKEVNKTSSFLVEVKGKQLDFKLVNVERIDKGNVSVKYFIEELVGEDHSIELQFLIFDLENKKEAEIKEIKIITANSNEEFETIIPIRENLEGELSLLVNLNSETYSAFVQENIVLGRSIGGFAVLGGEKSRNALVSIILIVLFLVFTFFITKKIRSHKKIIRHKQIREKYAYLLSPTY